MQNYGAETGLIIVEVVRKDGILDTFEGRANRMC
jgi:hypothetical protein